MIHLTFESDDKETKRALFSISSIPSTYLIPFSSLFRPRFDARSIFSLGPFDFSTPSSVFVWSQSRQSEERFLRLIDHREQRSLRKQIFRATKPPLLPLQIFLHKSSPLFSPIFFFTENWHSLIAIIVKFQKFSNHFSYSIFCIRYSIFISLLIFKVFIYCGGFFKLN